MVYSVGKNMVQTNENFENLPPEKRVEYLKELKAKKQEELEELMRQKEEELQSANAELVKSEEDLIEEDEHREKEDQEALEHLVEDAPESHPDNITYESPLERIPAGIYEFTNYNIYHEVKNINDNLAHRGYITADEQRRLTQIRQQRNALQDAYTPSQLQDADKSRGNYLSRVVDVLNQLDKEKHDVSLK